MELLADRLSKQYGRKIVADRISFTLHQGIYGLLGANGAGKTTLMRMLCGIIKPDSGTVTFNNLDVTSEEYRSVLGYLPQDFGFYPEFTGRDFLLYIASLKGINQKKASYKAKELLHLVSLEDMADRKIKTYSGGMRQRLGIAQSLLNDPLLLIMDEPTSGLDPKERVQFRQLLEKVGKESVVLLSTHILSDVEAIADRILIMDKGQIVFQGKWEERDGSLEAFYLQQLNA